MRCSSLKKRGIGKERRGGGVSERAGKRGRGELVQGAVLGKGRGTVQYPPQRPLKPLSLYSPLNHPPPYSPKRLLLPLAALLDPPPRLLGLDPRRKGGEMAIALL